MAKYKSKRIYLIIDEFRDAAMDIVMSFMGLSLQVHREIKSYTTHFSENKVDQIYFIEGNCGRVEANLDRTL